MMKLLGSTLFLFFFSLNCYALAPGDEAPNFQLPDISSDKLVSLDSYRGKIVYIDFWASWCSSCIKTFPQLNELLIHYQNRGLEVIAVNIDYNRQDALNFLDDNTVNFTVVYDQLGEQTVMEFGIKGVPVGYLIDRQGKIFAIHRGFDPHYSIKLQSDLNKLLKLQPETAAQ